MMENLETRRMLSAAVDPTTYVAPSSFLYKTGGYLTKTTKGDALTAARNYLNANASALGLQTADLANALVTDQYTDADTGLTHIYLQQTYNGLGVANASMTITLASGNRILSVGGTFVAGLGISNNVAINPALTATAALKKTAANLSLDAGVIHVSSQDSVGSAQAITLSAPSVSVDPIPAHLQYVAVPGGSVDLAWNFILDVPGGQHWYDANINASTGTQRFTADWVDNFSSAAGSAHIATTNDKSPVRLISDGGETTVTGISGGQVLVDPNTTTYSTTYDVYPIPLQSPSSGGRLLVTNPWDLTASPYGWQDTNGTPGGDSATTVGNNVSAQDDTDANNTGGNHPSGGSLNADGSGSLTFDFALSLASAPSTYQNAAITNLYYWNNLLHDLHYKYGFTEAAGNFQTNNYGNGGVANDAVQADAQDGAGTNNANFSAVPDGTAGRMQMYLFTTATPNRDGDLDAQVMVHEYGHGVSTRLTGGPANASALNATQSGGMGEGWSDWFSLMFLQTDGSVAAQQSAHPVGTYVEAQPINGAGIRRYPYSSNKAIDPETLGLYNTSSEVHNAGEIWCTALYDMASNLINKYGFNANVAQGYTASSTPAGQGNLLAIRLVEDAMKIQVANPSFLNARDAILSADNALNGGADAKQIWTAFAGRGFGVNATTASSSSTSVVENFDLPAQFTDPRVTASTPAGGTLAQVSSVSFTFVEPMNTSSFDVVNDVQSFTGPGAANLKPSITGFAWTNSNKTLTVNFPTLSVSGSYSMVIGPNILAADDNAPMDQNQDGQLGQANDTYTASFTTSSSYGPDAGGYSASATAFQSIDLVPGAAGVTTVTNGTDDSYGTYTLPAGNTFTFYGTSYSTIYISANGWISLGATAATSVSNGDLTTVPTSAAILPLWDDWRTDTNGTTAGATDSAGLVSVNGNNLIVEWSDLPNYNDPGNPATFQAILSMNTTSGRNGDIIFNYPDLVTTTAASSEGVSASVGIKGNGTQGTTLAASRLLLSQDGAGPGSALVGTGKAVRISATRITGTTYADNNGNGVQDSGELAVANVPVYYDANSNSILDAGDTSTSSNSSGVFALYGVNAGTDSIRVNAAAGSIINTVLNPSVTLAMGEAATSNVGTFDTAIVGTSGNDTTLFRSNAANDRVEMFINNSTTTPTYSILKSVLTRLSFAGGAGADTYTFDYSNGNPFSSLTNAFVFTGTGADTLNITGPGQWTFTADPAINTPNLTVNTLSSGSAVTFAGAGVSNLTALNFTGGGAGFLLAGGARTLAVGSLTFGGSASLDLNDNDLIVDYTDSSQLATIDSYIAAGRNGGAWNGTKIKSSTAAANSLHNTGLGAIEASDYRAIYGTTTFNGVPIDTTAVVVKYTYNGDADLNGKVDANDYARIDAGFQNQATPGFAINWLTGDFNFDGKVDANDYALIDAAFQTQTGLL